MFTGLVSFSRCLCKEREYEDRVVHLVTALYILREEETTGHFTASGRTMLLPLCACVCQSAGYCLS